MCFTVWCVFRFFWTTNVLGSEQNWHRQRHLPNSRQNFFNISKPGKGLITSLLFVSKKSKKTIKTIGKETKGKETNPPAPQLPPKKVYWREDFSIFEKKGTRLSVYFFFSGRESGVSRAIKGYIQGTRRYVQLQQRREEKDIIRDYNHLDMRG